MSPGRDLFRSRLSMYPSLLNCCSIDLFSDRSGETLTSFAKAQLTEIQFKDDNERNSVFDVCRGIHQSVSQSCVQFLEKMGRFNFVTPTSYL